MSERKYTARPPVRELDLAYNPSQPRDSHGRWVKTGGAVESAVKAISTSRAVSTSKAPTNTFDEQKARAAARAALAPKAPAHQNVGHDARAVKKSGLHLWKTRGRLVKKKVVEPTPRDLRHLRKLSDEARMELYREAGIKMKFPDKSTDDLLAEWHKPGHTTAERTEFLEEIERREKQLQVVRQAMTQSLKDFAREGHRDAWRRFDQNLRNVPGGKAVINMRERLLKDKWLDRQEVLSEWLHHQGKHYAGHVVTVVAIASVLHPIGLATIGGLGTAGLLNVPGADEAFSALMENLWVHSGLATALAPVADKLTGPAFDWLSKERKAERAKKYAMKHQTRTLHV